MTTKRFFTVMTLLIHVLLLAACAVTPAAETSSAPVSSPVAVTEGEGTDEGAPDELIPFKMGALPYMSNVILAIAQEEGFFTEQGLAMEIVPFRSFPEMIPLLLTGELDAATPAPGAGFFNAVAAGGDVRMALPLTILEEQECSSLGFMARKSDIEAGTFAEASQWQNARIGATPGGKSGISGFLTMRVLSEAGLTLDDIQAEDLEAPIQEEALRSGQVDIVYAVEPWLTRMRAAGDIDLLLASESIATGLVGSFIAFGAKPLHTPEVGERFATAYLQAVRQYLEGPTERNVELAAAYTGLDAELVRSICWTASSPSGTIDVPMMQEYQQWLFEEGLIDRVLEPAEYIESRFAEVANERLGDAGQ